MAINKPASKSPFLSIRFKVLIPLMVLLTIFFMIIYFVSFTSLKTYIFRYLGSQSDLVRSAVVDQCISTDIPDEFKPLTQEAQINPDVDWKADIRYQDIQSCLYDTNYNDSTDSFTYFLTDDNKLVMGVYESKPPEDYYEDSGYSEDETGYVEEDDAGYTDEDQTEYTEEDTTNDTGVLDSGNEEDIPPLGEEITVDEYGQAEYDAMMAGLSQITPLTDLTTADCVDEQGKEEKCQYFGVASPITDSSGKMVGGIFIRVYAGKDIVFLNDLSKWLFVIFAIIYILVAGIVLFITGSATSQLGKLNAAALRVAEGDYTPVKVKSQLVNDEVANLAGVFNTMLDKVRGREEVLKARVVELEILIDPNKRKEQVKEIVDSEFFQDLTARAASIRNKRRQSDQEEKPGDSK